uniref:Uncharacterized protein n=1 Tax=Anguilla anguilla TaxID=7936 RepID=A0A0E9PGQ1_ANGAN
MLLQLIMKSFILAFRASTNNAKARIAVAHAKLTPNPPITLESFENEVTKCLSQKCLIYSGL